MVNKLNKEKEWTIFLSHSSKDKHFADWLYDKLRSAELTVWYDRHEILVGDSIIKKINEGLKSSVFIIVVISSQAVKSNWVNAELEPKILEQIEDSETTILPVVLGELNPGEISQFLKGKKYIEFSLDGDDHDEKFRELLVSIEGHLNQRGLLKKTMINTLKPSIRNPFGLRGGVEPNRFVVPEPLIWEITNDIIKKVSVSIVGVSMMGKTSILKFLSSKRCREFYQNENCQTIPMQFVYIDLQEFTAKGLDQLMPEIAYKMSGSLPQAKRFQGKIHNESLDWIKNIAKKEVPGSPLWVLLFDEFDRVVEMKGINKVIFDNMRSLGQHYNLCYVIASRRTIIDLSLPKSVKTSPFFNIFSPKFLTVWDKSTVQKLMSQPCSGMNLELFTGEDYKFIVQLTAFHPLLLQIGCYHLFNARCSRGTDTLDYDKIQEQYMQEAESVYRYYWKQELSDTERDWILKCRQAIIENDQDAQKKLCKNTPEQKNITTLVKFEKLGLCLNPQDTIALPTGFQLYLEKL